MSEHPPALWGPALSTWKRVQGRKGNLIQFVFWENQDYSWTINYHLVRWRMFPKLYAEAERVGPTQTLNQPSDLNCNPDLSHLNNNNSSISKKMFYQFITNYEWNSQACAILLCCCYRFWPFPPSKLLFLYWIAHLEQTLLGWLNKLYFQKPLFQQTAVYALERFILRNKTLIKTFRKDIISPHFNIKCFGGKRKITM